MNPNLIELLARQHETELRRSACRHGLDRAVRRRGWAFLEAALGPA